MYNSKDIDSLLLLFEIRNNLGFQFPLTLNAFKSICYKSILLERLLLGKEIFDDAPPKKNNSSWYELMESGEALVNDVEFSFGNSGILRDYPYVSIYKFPWKIQDKIDDKNYIITYEYGKSGLRRLFSSALWSLTLYDEVEDSGSVVRLWRLKRINSAI